MGSGEYVFVVGQIGDKGSAERKRADDVIQYVIRPVVESPPFELAVRRADLDPMPGQITTHIVQGIINAAAVICDLTGRNPNVFYELGVAHAFARPVILLVKDPASLPFDFRNERVIPLGDDDKMGVAEAENAKRQLDAALTLVLAAGYAVTNLVTDAAAARSLDQLAPDNPVAAELTAIRDKLSEIETQLDRETPDWYADMASLRNCLEKKAEIGILPETWLNKLVTEDTSMLFDEWAIRLKETAARTWSARVKAAESPKRKPPASNPVFDEEPF
ncbi:MAG: hypothetical protein ACR2KK_03235 [Acidimicrobiales bacterium]